MLKAWRKYRKYKKDKSKKDKKSLIELYLPVEIFSAKSLLLKQSME